MPAMARGRRQGHSDGKGHGGKGSGLIGQSAATVATSDVAMAAARRQPWMWQPAAPRKHEYNRPAGAAGQLVA